MDVATESNKELSVYDRKQAIKLFQSAYVGRFDITYFDTNKDRKHDRIIAEISKKDVKDATNYIAGIIKTLNNKKGHNFVFIYHKGYIIANEKKSIVGEGLFDSILKSSNQSTYEIVTDKNKRMQAFKHAQNLVESIIKSFDSKFQKSTSKNKYNDYIKDFVDMKHSYVVLYWYNMRDYPDRRNRQVVLEEYEDKYIHKFFKKIDTLKNKVPGFFIEYTKDNTYDGFVQLSDPGSNTLEAYSIYSIPGYDDPSTINLKSADDRDPIYDRFNSTQQTTSGVQYSSEMDETEEFYLHDLQKIPLVSHYVNELHMSPKTAVNVIEAFLAENPYLNMYLINESSFKTQEAYDDALLDAFIAATEASNGNIELYNDALDYSTEFFYNLDESFYTEESVVRNRGIIDRAKHSIKKTLSPIAQNIVNQVDALIGDKAAKEEVITGSSLLKARRLFLKMIVMWKVPAILSALSILPGGWLGLILKIVIWVGSKASSLGAMKNLVSTGTGLGNGNDAIHDENTKLVLNELDLELKITREKIDDAKSKGDTKAKYQLMRIENNIEREIFRIKYGKTPDRSFVGERGN